MKEIACVNNDLYIIIGSYASNFLFPKQDYNELIFNDNYINGKPAYVIPHPSPLNIKWFKDNPKFLESRIYDIREKVYQVLSGNCHSI